MNPRDAARAFRALHEGPAPLVLPNAWDVGSALGFVVAGFPAVGTTSFGVAAAEGSPDGGRSTREATAALAARLLRLPVPVTADVEDGYSDDPDEVASYLAELGVAGVNIEDSTDERLVAPDRHAAKVAAIKAASPDLFVNARVDNYWLGQSANLDEALIRARAYVEAGADGIFVPGISRPDEIRTLTATLTVPVNVLPVPGMTVRELADLGVRRVSTGSLPYRAAIDAGVDVAIRLCDGETPPKATPYPQAQGRLVAYRDGKLSATGE